jgi:hypothetical protein
VVSNRSGHQPGVEKCRIWIPLRFAGFCIFEALEVYARAGALGSVHPGEASGGLALRPRSGRLRVSCADSNVLDQIYRFELVRRIPRVEAGP